MEHYMTFFSGYIILYLYIYKILFCRTNTKVYHTHINVNFFYVGKINTFCIGNIKGFTRQGTTLLLKLDKKTQADVSLVLDVYLSLGYYDTRQQIGNTKVLL